MPGLGVSIRQPTAPIFIGNSTPNGPSFTNSNSVNATGEKFAFSGAVWFPARSGTKDIIKVGFFFGGVTKAGGSALTVSLQNVSTATAQCIPDETQDQTVAVANADASFATNTWLQTGALSANRTVSFGEMLSVVIEYDGAGRLGSDVFTIRGINTDDLGPAHFSTSMTKVSGSWFDEPFAPNIILEFSDGSFGTLFGAFPCSALGVLTFDSSDTPDEYALEFSFPAGEQLEGASWMMSHDTGSSDAELNLYTGTTVLATVALDASHKATAAATIDSAHAAAPFDGVQNLTGGATYRLGIKPTTTNDIRLYYFDVAAAGHLQAHIGGTGWVLTSRTDAGSWAAPTTTRRLLLFPNLVMPFAIAEDVSPDLQQRVTQLFVEVAIDEDADADPPPTISACVVGGTVASGTNPSAGTSLLTATAPLVWMEVTVGATTYRWAKSAINHGLPKQARVLTFGTATFELTDDDGGLRPTRVTSVLDDTDRVIRGLWVSGQLKGARVEYYAADLATVIADGTPQRRFRGALVDCEFDADLQASITSVDAFTARLTSMDGEDLQIPQVLTNDVSDANPLERMRDKPVPLVYGPVSDEDDAIPIGSWECKYVASLSVSGFEALGNMHVFLGCLGVAGQVQSVFGADLFSGDPPIARAKIGAAAFGDWLFVPTMPGYFGANPWFDAGGRRYILLFGRDGHPVIEMARSGRIPLVINACGAETVGDSSGNTISSPPRVLLHLANNHILQDLTGDALAIASFGDYSMLHTASFEAVHTICAALGLVAAGVIGGDYQQRSWRDVIGDVCVQFGFDWYQNRDGQAALTMLDRANAPTIAAALTEDHILDGSVDVDLRPDAVENEVRSLYGRHYPGTLADLAPQEGSRLPRDPYDGEWRSGLQSIQNASSITALGGGLVGLRRSRIFEYSMQRTAASADVAAAQRLDLKSPPKGRTEVRVDLVWTHGADLQLGAIVSAEHRDFPWTGSRRCQIRGLEDDLDECTVRLTVRDVDDLLP